MGSCGEDERRRGAFHLQRHDLVIRDTERNLRLFAFVVRHATRQREKLQFDQYRPYGRRVRGATVVYWKQAALAFLMVTDLDEEGSRQMFLRIRKAL